MPETPQLPAGGFRLAGLQVVLAGTDPVGEGAPGATRDDDRAAVRVLRVAHSDGAGEVGYLHAVLTATGADGLAPLGVRQADH